MLTRTYVRDIMMVDNRNNSISEEIFDIIEEVSCYAILCHCDTSFEFSKEVEKNLNLLLKKHDSLVFDTILRRMQEMTHVIIRKIDVVVYHQRKHGGIKNENSRRNDSRRSYHEGTDSGVINGNERGRSNGISGLSKIGTSNDERTDYRSDSLDGRSSSGFSGRDISGRIQGMDGFRDTSSDGGSESEGSERNDGFLFKKASEQNPDARFYGEGSVQQPSLYAGEGNRDIRDIDKTYNLSSELIERYPDIDDLGEGIPAYSYETASLVKEYPENIFNCDKIEKRKGEYDDEESI